MGAGEDGGGSSGNSGDGGSEDGTGGAGRGRGGGRTVDVICGGGVKFSEDRSADGAERVAARVAGGGEEACVALFRSV